MSAHNFNFDGGEILRSVGATWFVSYAYYEKIDKSHRNWDRVSTAPSRLSSYNRGRCYHKSWLQEVLKMNPANLEKNTIGLSAEVTKKMAGEILAKWEGENKSEACKWR